MPRLILTGSLSSLQDQIALLTGIKDLIGDKDIGAWIGYPAQDYALNRPLDRKLYIQIYSQQFPPFRPEAGKHFRRAQLTVPNPKRSVLNDWKLIKEICGGINGYTYGRWRTTITYEGGRQTVAIANTRKISEKMATELALLSELQAIKMHTSQVEKKGVYSPGQPLFINEGKVYPGSYYVLSQRKAKKDLISQLNTPKKDEQAAKSNPKTVPTKSGKMERELSRRIPLWTKTPPRWLAEEIQKMWS
jgi:hypothetical protein